MVFNRFCRIITDRFSSDNILAIHLLFVQKESLNYASYIVDDTLIPHNLF